MTESKEIDGYDEKLLLKQLEKLNYTRRGVGVYAYDVGFEAEGVERFLYIQTYGKQRQRIGCYFGARIQLIEQFALKMISEYGQSPLTPPVKHNKKSDCLLNFPFGRIVGWSPRWSFDISKCPFGSWPIMLRADLERHLNPIFDTLSTKRNLLTTLLNDQEPMNWDFNNAAIRAVYILCLAKNLGMDMHAVSNALKAFSQRIYVGLAKQNSTEQFLKYVMFELCDGKNYCLT